jgi:hypothetical protein
VWLGGGAKMPFELPIHRPEKQEQRLHEAYRYGYMTDRVEGLIVVNVDTLADRNLRNNFLRRAVTFNPDGQLIGAVHLTVAGTCVYVLCAPAWWWSISTLP